MRSCTFDSKPSSFFATPKLLPLYFDQVPELVERIARRLVRILPPVNLGMLFRMAFSAHKLKVRLVKRNLGVADVLGSQMLDMVNDLALGYGSVARATLAKPVLGANVGIARLLPCLRVVESTREFPCHGRNTAFLSVFYRPKSGFSRLSTCYQQVFHSPKSTILKFEISPIAKWRLSRAGPLLGVQSFGHGGGTGTGAGHKKSTVSGALISALITAYI
jgi:hypothetical protein